MSRDGRTGVRAGPRGARFPWLIVTFVALGLTLALFPRVGGWLQYDRSAVESGSWWRLVSSQLVHWTPRMALVDLLVLGITGAWLELRSRRLLVGTSSTAMALVAFTVQFGPDPLGAYRGSSGIASALFVAMAAAIFATFGSRWVRSIAAAAIVAFGAKTILELATGATLFAGDLPHGVVVVPAVHLAGALAGLLCVVVGSRGIECSNAGAGWHRSGARGAGRFEKATRGPMLEA